MSFQGKKLHSGSLNLTLKDLYNIHPEKYNTIRNSFPLPTQPQIQKQQQTYPSVSTSAENISKQIGLSKKHLQRQLINPSLSSEEEIEESEEQLEFHFEDPMKSTAFYHNIARKNIEYKTEWINKNKVDTFVDFFQEQQEQQEIEEEQKLKKREEQEKQAKEMEQKEKRQERREKWIKNFQPLPDRSNLREITIYYKKYQGDMNEIDNSVLFNLRNCPEAFSSENDALTI